SRLTGLLEEKYSEVEKHLGQLERDLESLKRPTVLDSESRLRTAKNSTGETIYLIIAWLPYALFGVAAISLVGSLIPALLGAWSLWSWGAAGTITLWTIAAGCRSLLPLLYGRRSRWKLLNSRDDVCLKLRDGRRQTIDLTASGWRWTTSWLGRLVGLSWVEF